MKKVINIIVTAITVVAQAASMYFQFKAGSTFSAFDRKGFEANGMALSLVAIVGVVLISSILLSEYSTKSNTEENK